MSKSGMFRVTALSAVLLLFLGATPLTDACAADPRYDLATQRARAREELRPGTTFAPSAVDDRSGPASLLSVLDADTIPSPGITIGITSYDSQHNYAQGHQVATNPGSETVHFAWTMWDIIPSAGDDANRFVNYCSWDMLNEIILQGPNGVSVTLGEFARGGFVRMDVDSDNLCHAVLHQRLSWDHDYSAWHLLFPIEGSSLHLDSQLPRDSTWTSEIGHLWSDVAVSQNQGLEDSPRDICHVISMGDQDVGAGISLPSERLWYWRWAGEVSGYAWEGPVILDSASTLSYTIDACDNSGKVAVAFTSNYRTDSLNEVNNVVYRESRTEGLGWLDGSELGEGSKNFITTYDDVSGPRAGAETSTAYDHRGVLHIVFIQQEEPGSERVALRHWSDERGTVATVTEAYYPNPNTWQRSPNISQISLGIGDGATLCQGGATNEDYLYVLYTKLGGETLEEQADTSRLGFANGELYLTLSPNGGTTWLPPFNLTSTKSPNCGVATPDSVCASEAWGTIARDVSDIEVFYVRDYEAGAFHESGWSMNRVVYLS